MSLCLNPDCLKINAKNTLFCSKCGTKLLLNQRYRALRVLGQGGFGRTFLAIDEHKPTQSSCVIKQFFPQAQGTSSVKKASELFAQEALRLDELGKHNQIPELFAYFTQDERQYLVQEYIAGNNLAEELGSKGVFNEEQIRALLLDVLSVLQFVHKNHVIHRDIKPENLIRRQDDGRLVLVDFGAAKVAANINLSVTGTVIGSAEYTAPEQARGKTRYASDLYSLGVTCIHLLTKTPPFELFDVGEGEWVWRNYLKNNSISDELGQILDKLIASATKRRYQKVEEVIAALNPNSITINQIYSKSPSNSFSTTPKPAIQPYQTIKPLTKLQKDLNQSKFAWQFSPHASGKVKSQRLSQLPDFYNRPLSALKKFSFEVVSVNFQGKIIKREHKQVSYLNESLGNGVTMDLVVIPKGSFLMGSPLGEGSNSEKPQHSVIVRSFLMGKYPVTQAQWSAVVALPKVKRDLKSNISLFRGSNRPVERVSWYDAEEFCARLSRHTGKQYRLPSESEWEYACRAGTETPFHFGATVTSDLANYDGTKTYAQEPPGKYREETTPVGTFSANAFGLYDMHGNVWEWCADDWHDNYQGAPTDGSTWIGNGYNIYSPLRGGFWINLPRLCRSAYRDFASRDYRNYGIGFRVVCVSPRSI